MKREVKGVNRAQLEGIAKAALKLHINHEMEEVTGEDMALSYGRLEGAMLAAGLIGEE